MKLKVAPNLLFLGSLFFFLATNLFSQQRNPLISEDFPAQKEWVDSIYNSMSLEEKIGQLFMVDVFSNAPESKTDKIKKLIEEQHIGGVIFSKGGPLRQAKLTNEFQKASKVPLLVGMDAEWGLAMRLDSTFALPWNMTLGAIEENSLIEEAGAAISRHSKRLGVHINFAPVVDINTNPENPIIGTRSFGEEKENVTSKSLAFIRGMQREGILSSAKHFPGHGDTDSDSHKTLPTISFSKSRIENVELYPYKMLIEEGLSSIMVAHLNVPSLEEEKGTPSSLSKTVVTDLLKKGLNFNGLIFTDALNMKGASNFSNPGDIDLAAFLAGNDVLLISEDVPKGIQKITEAYNDGIISEQRLSHSVKKILFAKYKVGLNDYEPINSAFLVSELHSVRDDALFEKLTESSITVLKNNMGLLPFKKLAKKKFAYVNLGDGDGSAFLSQLRKYTKVDWVSAVNLESLLQRLEEYDRVIIGFHKEDDNPWTSYKFSNREIRWLYEIARRNSTVLNVFARPYALLDIPTFTDMEGVVVGYQNNEIAQQKVAQMLFGAVKARGKLPVSIGDEFPEGSGLRSKELNRLSYGVPETVGINSYKLKKIDSIISEAIEKKMTPGAQILIARKGKVIYNRNFGYQTYEEELPVTDTTVYDLASLTKILATLPLVMEQEEKGIISFDTKLGEMLSVFQNSNKENIRLQDMLMHYARLKVWIPFYISTLDKTTRKPSDLYYSKVPSEAFNTHVARDMYIRNDAQDTILAVIRDSDLERKKEYKYSDLPFYILKYYLESYYNTTLNSLTQERFYRPLGANYTGYLPATRFGLDQIAPTENDKLWRAQKVHGYVHDQGAAMQGGIGGHAGLFSNANDVAKIMQMYMNGGSYGGEKFFEPETISKFNTCYYCEKNVRRGVGFDKPQLGNVGPTCGCVSLTSFGHTGFTGTLAWADPEEEIIYVFLSNRTYPDSNNRKLIREDIRSKIQEVIYEAIDF
ncbi:glycoside hydrolase family 3 N-terminal domain-containing protein [Autumnicola psychrophila]|uniref:beta-N-acetylhexosaminidase n=1 Tax=Autumnicola psychrophila TaxID=3075592 RepID=A0ABU3DRZ9_9FLAO|nr:glycoside hydrolase family 3 N-terminal domain-containing protein [Zunongwangia sp. F225]MDT0686490.1 glycoside hydrolase family 3 N-terminal domain-containing protein [Zunongwangia sp. F225]